MGKATQQIIAGFFSVLAFSGAAPRAPAISTDDSAVVLAQQSSGVLGALCALGAKHGFTVAMDIQNGNGKYVLHIKQRHNETTERGLLRVDQTTIQIQASIAELLRDLRSASNSSDARLPVFLEGDIAPVLDFAPIRENIELIKRRARHADELFHLLREYYDDTFLRKLQSLRVSELAEINYLIAQALKPSLQSPDFLYVDGISSGEATPDELALMAGAAMKLHALGEVILMPAEGNEQISSALALVYKEGRAFFETLAGAILQWTPPAEHESLLALLHRARSMHRYQWLVPRLQTYAVTPERALLLEQFRERANRVTDAVFIARERKTIERLASYLRQSSEKHALLIFGVDHNFAQAVTESNATPGIRLGLVTYTHNTEFEGQRREPMGFPGAARITYCTG